MDEEYVTSSCNISSGRIWVLFILKNVTYLKLGNYFTTYQVFYILIKSVLLKSHTLKICSEDRISFIS